MRRQRFTASATSLVLVIVVLAMPVMQGVCAAAGGFIPPVDGPVIRSFEAPLGPYAAGHRGIDFGVVTGTVVAASSDGVVTFAGPVADDGMFVTVRHDAELETTYSFMSRVDVGVGDKVKRGKAIGLSGAGHEGGPEALHFGAKVAGVYIDPQLLLMGDLDAISKMISLAPMEEEAIDESFFLDGGSAFGPPPERRQPSGGKGLFVSVGSGLAAAGRWLLKIPSLIGGFVSGIAQSGWGLAKDAASVLWSAAKGVGGAIVDEVRTNIELLKMFGKMVVDSMKQAWDAVKGPILSALRLVKRAAISAWRGVVAAWRGVVGAARATWRFIASVPGRIWSLVKKALGATATAKLARGLIEQRRCAGAPRGPSIPTTAEMRAGAKPPPAPNDNIVVAVAGIGSSTMGKNGEPVGNASIYQLDFETLGYKDEQIFHYSYRGLEDRGGRGPYRLHAPYTKEDTYKSIARSAAILDRQLVEIHKRYPDREIDLVAHSQGGLVASYYITNFYRPEDPRTPVLRNYVSIATPHRGADAAKLGVALSKSLTGEGQLRLMRHATSRLGLPPPSSEAAMEMAEGSSFLTELESEWNPAKVRATTVAATLDYVVSPKNAHLKGATQLTADLPAGVASMSRAHSLVATSASTKSLVYSALSGQGSPCTALRNEVSNVVGTATSVIEDFLVFGWVSATTGQPGASL